MRTFYIEARSPGSMTWDTAVGEPNTFATYDEARTAARSLATLGDGWFECDYRVCASDGFIVPQVVWSEPQRIEAAR